MLKFYRIILLFLLLNSTNLFLSDETVGKQAKNLENITSSYEHDKKYWAAAVNDLQEKIEASLF